MQTKTIDLSQQNTDAIKPYPPSFLDTFMNLVQQMPFPYWLTYLIFFIVQGGINHIFAWIDGSLAAYTFNPTLLMFPLWLWGPLAIMTYLDRISEEVLSSFSSLLDIDEERLNKLKSEFTIMPARGVIWAIVYIILTYSVYDAYYVKYGVGNLIKPVVLLEGLIDFSTSSVIYYHSLRQLWLVNRTVKMVKRFNLFHLDPVYAFSHLTSRTGISWMILLGLTLLMYPIELAQGLVLAIWILQIVLALAAFILPLQFVHYRLVQEKRKLLADHQRRVEFTLACLHQSIDQQQLGEVGQLNTAIAGLNAERTMLERIPTWPWRTDTLTGFLSATILPIILFLIQNAIRKWLGG